MKPMDKSAENDMTNYTVETDGYMNEKPVRRSGLTMPVNNLRFVGKAWTRGCDFIILDLEDSVPPSKKSYARTLVRDAIQAVSRGGAEVFVRINHDTVGEDLESAVWPGLKRINYPKTESAEEIRQVDTILTELERARGLPVGSIEIGANVETARGVVNALEIACSSHRIKEFGGGGGYDMSRDLGIEMFVNYDQVVYGKGELELAARVMDLELHAAPFIADLTGSVSDGEYAFRLAEATRKSGFLIGGGLHPNVVDPQNRGFTPSPTEVEDAQYVIARYTDVEKQERVSIQVDGRIIDKYEDRRARALVDWARLCARRDREKSESVATSTEDSCID